jgi:hypothetical protein
VTNKKFDDVLARVIGTSMTGKKVEFEITGRDIKHLRRVIHFWDFIHPNLQQFDTATIQLYKKLRLFGRLSRSQKHLSEKLKDRSFKCEKEGCEETENLTIHHINGKRGVDVNRKDNLQWLCPKHHLLEELNRVLKVKLQEIEKVQERIKKVENSEKSDMLGYHTNKNGGIVFEGFSEDGDFNRENNIN